MNCLFFLGLNFLMLSGSGYFIRILWELYESIFTKQMRWYVAPMDVKHASYDYDYHCMTILFVCAATETYQWFPKTNERYRVRFGNNMQGDCHYLSLRSHKFIVSETMSS